MPRRLNQQDIISLLARYGFTITEPNFQYRNNKQRIRVHDDIMDRDRVTTINNLQQLIRRGRIAEVDPFLHALNRTDTSTLTLPTNDALTRKILKFAETQIPQFLNESRDVQKRSIKTAQRLLSTAAQAQNTTITRTHDSTTDRISLYAFIDTVYKVAAMSERFSRHRVTLNIKANGIDTYLFINENTIGMLNDLIEHVYFGEPLHELTDSSTAALFSLVAWETMTIMFNPLTANDRVLMLDGPKLNPTRRRRNAGALWRYLNKSDIDLSRYGIFKTFDPVNYKYSCFVYALQQSGQFTPEEIELINDCINTRAFPCDTIKKICQLFNCYIEVTKYSEKYSNKKTYGDKSADKKISLLLRDAHYMLNENLPITPYYVRNMERIHQSPRVNQERKYQVRTLTEKSVSYHKKPNISINELLDILFEKKLFKRFTPRQTFRVLNRNKHYDFTDLKYAAKCVKHTKINPISDTFVSQDKVAILNEPTDDPMPPFVYTSNIQAFAGMAGAKVIKFKSAITKIVTPPLGAQALSGQTPNATIRNLKLLFMFEPTLDELKQFHDIMLNRFNVNVFEFDTLAQIGHEMMLRYKCYDDVPELAGKPATFIKQCAPKICVQPAFNEPLYKTGSLVQIDKNGSYSATYAQFNGIPKGEPKLMTSMDFINRETFDYFYVLINVESFKCKHAEDRFPILTSTGPFFCDKNTLEFITTHYDAQYSFFSGYYFNEGFNTRIKTLAYDLYQMRLNLKAKGLRIESCFKLILASLWGKAQTKRSIFKNVMVSNDKFEDFAVYNHSFLYKSVPISDDLNVVSLLNPVSLHYTRPQFSTNVLSHARCSLNSLFYQAADLDVPIYYSNTDSLVLDTVNLHKLGPILGDDLGQFKIERENITKFICISAKKYIQVTPTESKVVGLHKLKNKPDDVEEYFEKLYNTITSIF